MKKEEIYVVIDSEEKRLRALEILQNANETICWNSALFEKFKVGKIIYIEQEWSLCYIISDNYTETNLDQLNQLLNPNYAVTEVNLSVEELRLQAERLGFELTEKKREIKVGDFGVFWDRDEEKITVFGFLTEKNQNGFKKDCYWDNFRYLTEEEKQKIQENW